MSASNTPHTFDIPDLPGELTAEAASLASSAQSLSNLSDDFLERCSIAPHRTILAVKLALKPIPDFSSRDFDKLLKEAAGTVKKFSKPHVNGHAANHAHSGDTPKGDLLSYLLNDHGNACRIRDLYGDDLRYCYDTKAWLVWDGNRWAAGDIGQARQLAKQTMLEFLRVSIQKSHSACEKFAKESLEVRRINGMLSMLESDLPIRATDLDANPWLLNCLNGTIDLRTAELLTHDRADFITKLVHYRYDPSATCPLWTRFLEQIMGGGDQASEAAIETALSMTDYLQRALGYSCTGSTSEKAVFVPFGSGNNGKSTMLTVVRQILAEYSTLIQVDTLMTRQENNNTQTDLADLRGARFVQTSETEEGQKISQGKLKRITQGMGTIRAARKYENMIEFPETHKLWMDTNRKPEIRDAEDQALFNRLHPIPFNVTITAIDKSFPSKLMSQATGILAWLAQGAHLWFKDQSLSRPKSVDDASNDWREHSAHIGRFIAERHIPPTEKTTSAYKGTSSEVVYKAYKAWCDSSTEKPLKRSIFIEKMAANGYPTDSTGARHFVQNFHLAVLSNDGSIEPCNYSDKV